MIYIVYLSEGLLEALDMSDARLITHLYHNESSKQTNLRLAYMSPETKELSKCLVYPYPGGPRLETRSSCSQQFVGYLLT